MNERLLLSFTLDAAELLGVTHGKRGTLQNPYKKPKEPETAETTVYREKLNKAYQRGYRRERRKARKQKDAS